MPKTCNVPQAVRPYVFQGLDVQDQDSYSPKTDCPFCGREGKFGISNKDDNDGRFRCVACNVFGNAASFMEQLHELSMTQTSDYSWIANHRNLPVEAIRAWGVCKSAITGEWVIPAYSASGKVVNLYRYVSLGGKYIAMETPNMPKGLFGFNLFDTALETVYVGEGPWDGVAVWDAMQQVKAAVNVVATPGCAYFSDTWVGAMAEKNVVLLYDNDYPRERNGQKSPPAGWEGTKRATKVLAGGDPPPKSISFLAWDSGEDGFDAEKGGKGYTDKRADGFDCRDLLSPKRCRAAAGVTELLEMIRPCPASWREGAARTGANRGDYMRPETCKSWADLDGAWEDAALWGNDVRGALVVILSSIASVKGQGEQVWVKLISPPATFKSKLCAAAGVARKFVVEDDGMNGFFSGAGSVGKDGKEQKDRSLVARLYNRTLITKEGATLVDSPMRDIIISQARSLYDGSANRTYNNGVRWEHHGLRFTWILAGTPSLRRLDASELGQRFIDYVIMESIDPVYETKIMTFALAKQLQASQVTSNCKAESTVDGAYAKACKLTGGYIEHLKTVAPDHVRDVKVHKSALERLGKWASFIEYMRARPSDLEDGGCRALATRVGGQILKMAQYAAVVVEKDKADHKMVWDIVEKVGRDTARGRTYKICQKLSSHPAGLSAIDVSRLTGYATKDESNYLAFLVKLGAVDVFDPHGRKNVAVGKYRLSKRFSALWKEVAK